MSYHLIKNNVKVTSTFTYQNVKVDIPIHSKSGRVFDYPATGIVCKLYIQLYRWMIKNLLVVLSVYSYRYDKLILVCHQESMVLNSVYFVVDTIYELYFTVIVHLKNISI